MRRYVIRRLLQAVVLLFVMSIAFFALLHAIPGGPESVIFNPRMTLAQRAAIRVRYGLDKPLPIQYLTWLTHVLRADFGNSLVTGIPVGELISSRFSATFELFAAALLFALVVAIPLGVIAAVRQYTITDYTATVLAYFGISIPVFWFALVLQEIFGAQLHLLPVFGQRSSGDFPPFDSLQDYALHLILPAIVLSLQFIAVWSRFLRSSMLDVVKQDYIRTARAKGLTARSIFFRHALRNALIPLITQIAIDVGALAGGAVITETVFSWPGMGQLFINSLNGPDYPIVLAYLLIGSAFVIGFNLIADLLYAVIDPRIRYS